MTEEELPRITLRQFLRALSHHTAPDDEYLSANTLRIMFADIREHAKRLYVEIQEDA